MAACVCDPLTLHGDPYVQWIGTWFSTCAYGTRDFLGFFAAMVNIVLYVFVQVPQIILTCKKGDASGLSSVMVCLWWTADLCGLLGLLLTGQRGTLFIIQFYLFIVDCVLCGQWAFFKWIRPPPIQVESADIEALIADQTQIDGSAMSGLPHEPTWGEILDQAFIDSELAQPNMHTFSSSSNMMYEPSAALAIFAVILSICVLPMAVDGSSYFHSLVSSTTSHATSIATSIGEGSMLAASQHESPILSLNHVPVVSSTISAIRTMAEDAVKDTVTDIVYCNKPGELQPWQDYLGIVLAMLCMVLNSPARVFQIIRIYHRKSAYGMARVPVFLTIIATAAYVLSVFLPSANYERYDGFTSRDFLLGTLPYVIAVSSAFCASCVLLFQTWYYRQNNVPNYQPPIKLTEFGSGVSIPLDNTARETLLSGIN